MVGGGDDVPRAGDSCCNDMSTAWEQSPLKEFNWKVQVQFNVVQAMDLLTERILFREALVTEDHPSLQTFL